MKRKQNRFLLSVIFSLSLLSCKKTPSVIGLNEKSAEVNQMGSMALSADNIGTTQTFYGQPVMFNNSSLRSYFILQQGTVPLEIGYELNDAVFNNLPNANAQESQQLLLTLPSQAKQFTVFDHLTFQWNPFGHDPLFAFGSPHFDFHYYQIPVSERLLIDMNNPAIMIAPASDYIPANYYGPTGPMSQMGNHWVDLLSPEFNGGTFTKTFIYGSNNGTVIFEEPMITLAHLLAPANELSIRQPLAYQQTGYYPTRYGVKKSGGKTYAYLRGFVYRTATEVI